MRPLLKRAALTLLPAFLMVPGSAVQAHPHAWIDMRTAPVFDAQGRITALRVDWLFDEIYSLFSTEAFDDDGDGLPDAERLHELVAGSMERLAPFGYFTELRAGDARPGHDTVVDYSAEMQGERLLMRFTLPLSEAVDPRAAPFSYAVYDPTFYIQILHQQDNPVAFEGAAPAGCGFDLRPPDPDEELVAFAAALDQTQSGGDGLGAHFAEWVSVTCGPEG